MSNSTTKIYRLGEYLDGCPSNAAGMRFLYSTSEKGLADSGFTPWANQAPWYLPTITEIVVTNNENFRYEVEKAFTFCSEEINSKIQKFLDSGDFVGAIDLANELDGE
jgi:hypothetical protein